MSETSKLKRAVIKEELVCITGDYIKAVILNQFLYWAERIKDVDSYIEQENARAVKNGYDIQDLTDGWIYKSAKELAEETMLNLSVATMRTHINTLIEKGYINQRRNPKYKWDKTLQYRVNLVNIAIDLDKNGYYLDGYPKIKIESSKTNNRSLKIKNGDLKIKNQTNKNQTAIPEINTETTSKITNNKERKKESFNQIITDYVKTLDISIRAEVADLLFEWLKVRKAKRAAMTDKAIQLNIDKLNNLAEKSGMSVIEYLEEVICKGWAAFYEIKNYNANTPQQKESSSSDIKLGGTHL